MNINERDTPALWQIFERPEWPTDDDVKPSQCEECPFATVEKWDENSNEVSVYCRCALLDGKRVWVETPECTINGCGSKLQNVPSMIGCNGRSRNLNPLFYLTPTMTRGNQMSGTKVSCDVSSCEIEYIHLIERESRHGHQDQSEV